MRLVSYPLVSRLRFEMHWAASWSELTKTASEYASNVSEIVAPVATDDDELSLKEVRLLVVEMAI